MSQMTILDNPNMVRLVYIHFLIIFDSFEVCRTIPVCISSRHLHIKMFTATFSLFPGGDYTMIRSDYFYIRKGLFLSDRFCSEQNVFVQML